MNINPIKELAEKVANELGYVIYDIKLSRRKNVSDVIIRIDKNQGYISINDCSKFSKKMGVLLDKEDVFPFKYNLRIESPGVERELRSLGDFKRFKGEPAKIIFNIPVENRSAIVGKIENCEEDMIKMIELDTKKVFEFRYNNVKKANLKLIL
jgi:ribosome maturation factor RimP